MDTRRRSTFAIVSILIIASMACSIPGLSAKPTPTTAQPVVTEVVSGVLEPTATPQPLPPALVEAYPPPGSEIPLSQPITFYFNQPMDRASVQGAISGQPVLSGSFTWESDSSLTFTPDAPFLPETDLEISLGSEAHSRAGLALANPLTIRFRTTGFLKLTQVLPEPGGQEIDPTSAVVASFNRPVVALGADPAGLPAAFTITSADGAQPTGQGEWTNTGTYIFYPEPALAGGQQYTVMINTGLRAVDGAPLDPTENPQAPLAWTFTTSMPRLVAVWPPAGQTSVRLDPVVVLNFSQIMDPASVDAAFDLYDPFFQAVPGTMDWSDDGRQMTFHPEGLLARGSQYQVFLSGSAQALGGTSLGQDASQTFTTVSPLMVSSTRPFEGEIWNPTSSVELYFTSVINDENLLDYVSIYPEVPSLNYYFDETMLVLRLFGSFEAATSYTVTVSKGLEDAWGQPMVDDFTLNYQTGSLDPALYLATGTDVFFMTPQDRSITLQATNLTELPLSIGSVPLDDFILMAGYSGYDIRQTYQPPDEVSWTQPVSLAPNRVLPLEVPLQPDGSAPTPGLYYLRMNPLPGRIFAGPYLAVVSNLNLTFKISQSDALVWAVDLRTSQPAAGVPVSIYDEFGSLLVQGQTDDSGLFQAAVGPFLDSYSPRYAVTGTPGDDNFGLAISNWNYEIEGHKFGFSTDFEPQGLITYLYTDRPIYRPGQTVYFRAVVRQSLNGRYSMPEVSSIPLVLYDDIGQVVSQFDLPVSAFGTAQGEWHLPEDARPGYYRLGEYPNSINISVAEYRKPEINLSVTFPEDQVLEGETLQASVNARYYFDAPASNVPLIWTLYQMEQNFEIPGYMVGDSVDLFDEYYPEFYPQLGFPVDTGSAVTGPDGLLSLSITPPQGDPGSRKLYTLEVTLSDETGLPVTARGQITSNPAPYYIGLHPSQWFGRAGSPVLIDVQTTAWDGSASAEQGLLATFSKVTWVKSGETNLFGMPVYVPEYELEGSAEFVTGSDGRAVLSFTPSEAGTYELRAEGGGTASSIILWVGGEGSAVWPEIPNQRLAITAGSDSYRPGDTASLFIPNPFGSQALALVSVERGVVMRAEVVAVPAGGLDYSLPLSLDDAPNIYVGVTLLGKTPDGRDDFRQGYTELMVDPSQMELNVSLSVQPENAGPGDQITVLLRVADDTGSPVQGEFSLSVVDLAALALADPNSLDIRTAFYGEQPLSVKTALSLVVSTRRLTYNPGGLGGGGGGDMAAVARENFPDTAFWNPSVITNENGEVSITFTLPDNLTTWQVEVRGVTANTLVGQAASQLVTSKDLLIRPVTPRFLVAGDHVRFSAVVHNSTEQPLDVQVSLQAAGVVLDDPSLEIQQVSVLAGGRLSVEWWGVVEDVSSVDLTFTASSGQLVDAARPSNGRIPVTGYSAPQAFATAGILDGSSDLGGLERLELISLPQSFDPRRGELRLELSPSLGAAVIQGLEAIEASSYESTDQILSRFLPNLEAYRALTSMGIQSPDLQARLDRTLQDGLSRLVLRQNDDGGWGWWSRSESDPYITAYVLFGFARSQEAGIQIDPVVLEQGVAYLASDLASPSDQLPGSDLDRLSFKLYALAELNYLSPDLPVELFEFRDRLSPWAQALLALTFNKLSEGDPRVSTLLSDIQGQAVRSAASVHWEDREFSWYNNTSPLTGTAMVVYALARLEPASPLIPEAVRYLMANRQPQGGWRSTYESAWTILAVVDVMKGTGEWTGEYTFEARLNGSPFAGGQVTGAAGETGPILAVAPLENLYASSPNALEIIRSEGDGRLYYTAYLDLYQPVETVRATNQGVTVERGYYLRSCLEDNCLPVSAASMGEPVQVRLTLNLPYDTYNLVVEDFIPAGSEILDTSLNTSRLGAEIPYDLSDPSRGGWGWWFFSSPHIYDDHITWASGYVPAGTYELTYTLVLLQPGEYHVIPAQAFQYYFPEVRGNTAGAIFEITQDELP